MKARKLINIDGIMVAKKRCRADRISIHPDFKPCTPVLDEII